MKVLKKMMRERMADAGRQREDFFDVLIEELRRDKPVMTEAIALDLMFVLLFASFEMTALALTLGVKLLAENPRVLRALTVIIRPAQKLHRLHLKKKLHGPARCGNCLLLSTYVVCA